MATLSELLSRLDTDSQVRGRQFERICKWFLENDPKYRLALKKVWLWNEWPGRWGPDAGIDLVAETHDKKLWAVQAKAYDAKYSIKKRDVDTFLSESARGVFSYRLVIATTNYIGNTAERTLCAQEKPVGRVLLTDLEKTDLIWPESPHELVAPRPVPKTPLPHQQVAIADVCNGFSTHDRGQLIMACGTGKTLVALWVAEQMQSQRTLVLVPSLSLLAQTLREWTANAAGRFRYLPVCSDDTVRGQDRLISRTSDLGLPVTTVPNEVAAFLRGPEKSVVFATYQSSPVIAEAFSKKNVPLFDLAVADEAHRCTGRVDRTFTTVLDATAIRSRRRLFMTATPRYLTDPVRKRAEQVGLELASMDDNQKFGPKFHELKFPEAIRKKLLSDYQVVVVGVDNPTYRKYAEHGRFVTTDGKRVTDARVLASHIGVAKAMRKHDLHRMISFHGRVERARQFAKDFPDVVCWMPKRERPSGQLWSAHVSGQMPSGDRDNLLGRLRHIQKDERGLLANARCLGEGVDVPVLDGVAFIDPKHSTLDIIQAVGRAIRKAEGKGSSTVVIPVFVGESESADETLSKSAFEPVWRVLRAVRAHDAHLAEQLDGLRTELGKRPALSSKVRLPEKIKLDIPTRIRRDFAQAFYVRTVEKTTPLPPLTIEKILEWANAHRERTGAWPREDCGPVHGAPGETWNAISLSLSRGSRGLPGGSSLAKLLAQHLGVRNKQGLPPLTIEKILEWIESHHKRTGEWPTQDSGRVDDAAGETWKGVNLSLTVGRRGLPGGSSLPKLLAEHFGVKSKRDRPRLTINRILGWIKAYHECAGEWPKVMSGRIPGAPGETWANINASLQNGSRGLPGNSSLAKLLRVHLGVRGKHNQPTLTVKKILGWAKAHHKRAGEWPAQNSGPIRDAPGETWQRINSALRLGLRGLPGGSSLAQLGAQHFGIRNIHDLPYLTLKEILEWMHAYHERTGKWPKGNSGPILDAPGETWGGIQNSLRRGRRGLPVGLSLSKLREQHFGVKSRVKLPPLTVDKILVWADAHYKRTGQWPKASSGYVLDVPAEAWRNIGAALRAGCRGLPGGSSLTKLLTKHRGVRNRLDLPPLTVEKILRWMKSHYERTGEWPTQNSGPVQDARGETWNGIDKSLRRGRRGLRAGSSLVNLRAQHFGVQSKTDRARLTTDVILAWLKEHHERTGEWPRVLSGPIARASGETWANINAALQKGSRGLPGGSSVARLLTEHFGVRNPKDLAPLTLTKILGWMKSHHNRTGQWPARHSGPVYDAPEETWKGIDKSLRTGRRGLPGRSSLAKLRAKDSEQEASTKGVPEKGGT